MPPLVADRLDGRCAVVTGGGRGFGERIALELDALGATVAVLDVDEEAARCSGEGWCEIGFTKALARELAPTRSPQPSSFCCPTPRAT